MALETNEDSSYDSDFEADAGTEGAHATPSEHRDVSRTVSDTLAAEFAEYVNAAEAPQPTQPTQPTPGYSARVEFGLKLGYSEKLVQAALHKLGPEPSQNELLGELIKLGAQSPRSPPDSPSASLVDDAAATVAVASAAPQQRFAHDGPPLRPIVIDGSNVAMSHGNKEFFSCRGIKICVDWFVARGHKEITVFVPKWRKESSRPDHPITEQDILYELERDRFLVFTPSRLVGGKRYVCYDDRYILKLAAENEGIVVSNDNYRDLAHENPEFKKVVEERILMYSFVNDLFMPPDDPLGRAGPTLDNFLRLQKKAEPSPRCPYGKKCTYGNKCKFHHPERGNLPQKSVADRLTEHAQKQMLARGMPREANQASDLKTHSLPLYDSTAQGNRKIPLSRARSAAPAPPPIDAQYHASVVSNFNRAQLEHFQSTNKNSSNHKLDPPPKSHSIENINSGFKELSFNNDSTFCLNTKQGVPFSQQSNHWNAALNQNEMSNWMYRDNQEGNENINMHRKLQRQLTINPAYDPRLLRLHGCNQNIASTQAVRNQWSEHQVVSRIASAPAACSVWPSAAVPGASASEPHLHPLPPQNIHSQWSWTTAQTSPQDVRNHLHYHLASIFPEEQVVQAMLQYPDETNPQKICAAILNMFHKTQ